jgi:hypothetical protein
LRFSASCPLCKHMTNDIEIAKCEGCSQIVLWCIDNDRRCWVKDEKVCGIAIPPSIIDGEIKVVDILDLLLICGEDLYMTKNKSSYQMRLRFYWLITR